MKTFHSTKELHWQTVRKNIHDGSTFDWPYFLMNILAATIAGYGLLANSPSVVIGAMIVAMLLGPITGIGLALLENDMPLLGKSFCTLIGGAIGVIVTGFILGIVHREVPISHEIMARTAPNLFDLMIALASGAAGAYAAVSPRLSVAFVGVAIATALVPPLVSASILLAHQEPDLAMGAFLLAFTNMVAIQFTSSVVLWLTHYRSAEEQKQGAVSFVKRNAVSVAILLALGVLLSSNLKKTISHRLFESTTVGILEKEINASVGSHLGEVRFETRTDQTTIVRAVVRGPSPPSAKRVADIEAKLPEPPNGTQIELRIRFVPIFIINRSGQIHNDVQFGDTE